MICSKLLKYLGVLFSIIILLSFLDYTLGQFLEGWYSPKWRITSNRLYWAHI